MSSDELPDSLKKFIWEAIDSVEQLNVLLLLYENPEKVWSVEAISGQLRSTVTSIQKRLDDLYSRSVIRPPEGGNENHRFVPFSESAAADIELLSEWNKRSPYRVIDAIYSRSDRALNAFADAFKLKKEK